MKILFAVPRGKNSLCSSEFDAFGKMHHRNGRIHQKQDGLWKTTFG
jgi:hypothetical protein